MKLEVGNEITWNSAAGNLIGRIKSVYIGMNAGGTMVPWMLVSWESPQGTHSTVLCGTDQYLKMMKVRPYLKAVESV